VTVSKRTRYEVLRRDNHTCRYCGGTAPDAVLTIDHVTPVALGGSDSPENLVACCKDCNAGKTSVQPGSDLVADVKQADIQWAGAMRRAAEITAGQRAELEAYVDAFDHVWGELWVPMDYMNSLHALRKAGLPVEDMQDAASIAFHAKHADDPFRYFAGVAWNKVTALQEIAKALLEAGEGDP
jgi:hypothetical protein